MTINSVQTTNKNTCPHGLPSGACPICGGMMGGGSAIRQEKVQKPKDEWSWMKCYIEGQMMRGQKARQEASNKLMTNSLEAQSSFAKSITTFASNVKALLNNVYNSLPPSIQNVFTKIANAVLAPLNNLMSKIPNLINEIQNMARNVKEIIMSVSEKLTAIFGELKNFIDKKIMDKLKRLTKKMLRIFIWEKDEEHNEIDEELEKFRERELKKIHQAILYLDKKEEIK